jgi:hypothetical protein
MSSYSSKYSETVCEQKNHDGTPCKSLALRDKKYCHYHEVCGSPRIDISNAIDLNPVYFDLPLLDDATSRGQSPRFANACCKSESRPNEPEFSSTPCRSPPRIWAA